MAGRFPLRRMNSYLSQTRVRFAKCIVIGQMLPALFAALILKIVLVRQCWPDNTEWFIVNAANRWSIEPENHPSTLSNEHFYWFIQPWTTIRVDEALWKRIPRFCFIWKWGNKWIVKQLIQQSYHVSGSPEAYYFQWAGFSWQKLTNKRLFAITIHSDMGNDASPTLYLPSHGARRWRCIW